MRRSRGYTLVALIVGMTIMSILIAAMLPLASTEARRDQEDELIFRGVQYAEGIRTFRHRYGRYPNTLKEMFEVRPRTLRKLWKDPITKSDKWGLVTLTTGAPLPGTTSPSPPGGGGGGGGGGAAPASTPAPTPRPTSGFGGGFGAPPDTAAGPITGVYSLSKKKAFRLYQGRETYNEWRFTEQTILNAAPTTNQSPCSGTVKPGPGC